MKHNDRLFGLEFAITKREAFQLLIGFTGFAIYCGFSQVFIYIFGLSDSTPEWKIALIHFISFAIMCVVAWKPIEWLNKQYPEESI